MLARLLSLLPTLSVRARIILIALVPVFGLLFNGWAYHYGEAEVAAAFASARRAAAVAEASSELKGATTVMMVSAPEFVARPSQQLAETFKTAQILAASRLGTIQLLGDQDPAAVELIDSSLADVAKNFDVLVAEEKRLGYTATEGLRGRMQQASEQVETMIGQDLSKVSDGDAKRLLASLHQMLRYGAELSMGDQVYAQHLLVTEHKTFEAVAKSIDASAEFRERLIFEVQAYVDTFSEWVAVAEKIKPSLTAIEQGTAKMLPAMESILSAARQKADQASTAQKAAQRRTQFTLVAVGIAIVLIGLLFSALIIRSINRPLRRLSSTMQQLADGDTNVRVPETQTQDEIGDMARTVLVFRNSMVEREQLAATQLDASRAREVRGERINATIARFDGTVTEALNKLRGAAARLESTSMQLDHAADSVSAEASTAEQRVGVASNNVTGAAASIEELVVSINEIASQVSRSNDAASHAVTESRHTTETMETLADTAARIGEVVGLIQSIAAQTNLLALNATIEAARAGEAGRGFAVVAAEVKSLSSQTAQATEGIAGQIRAIQEAATGAVQAIQRVNTAIEDMSGIAGAVAATVEEQNAAVSNIAEGVNRASVEAQTGAEAMSRVAGASAGARSTAADVKALADVLSAEAESLETEVRHFLAEVEAA
jgi:methyl-accepting chemotaxis protein